MASNSSPQRKMGMSGSMIKGGGSTPPKKAGLSGQGVGRTKTVSRGASPYKRRLKPAGEG